LNNTNLIYPISYRFKVIADYCSNFCRKRSLCVRGKVRCSS